MGAENTASQIWSMTATLVGCRVLRHCAANETLNAKPKTLTWSMEFFVPVVRCLLVSTCCTDCAASCCSWRGDRAGTWRRCVQGVQETWQDSKLGLKRHLRHAIFSATRLLVVVACVLLLQLASGSSRECAAVLACVCHTV
jgi:hypothetical protein